MLHSTNPNQPKLTINLFQSEQDDVNEITELLHQAYAPLAKRGLNYVAATQSNSITEERLLSGIAYIVRADGNIVGTLTYYPSVLKDSTEPDFYKVFGTAHFGQFAISPLMQRSGIGSM